MTSRRTFITHLATVPIAAGTVCGVTWDADATTKGSSALQVLAANYVNAVRASDRNDSAGVLSEEDFEAIVDEECRIARLIALEPAGSLADLAIKAVVALRETGTNLFKVGKPVDCERLLAFFDNKERPDLGELIGASIALDIFRLTARDDATNQLFRQEAE